MTAMWLSFLGKRRRLLMFVLALVPPLLGMAKNWLKNAGKMGLHYGIAFQIIDDLLDYGFGAKDLDKAKFTDVANGLVTLPLIFSFQSV